MGGKSAARVVKLHVRTHGRIPEKSREKGVLHAERGRRIKRARRRACRKKARQEEPSNVRGRGEERKGMRPELLGWAQKCERQCDNRGTKKLGCEEMTGIVDIVAQNHKGECYVARCGQKTARD